MPFICFIFTEVVEADDKADASLFNKMVHNKLVEVTQSSMLDVLQKDPNSPLYSVKSFEELRL